MAEETVLVEDRGGYRVLTLNRPDRLNAFTVDMHRALAAALDEAKADPGCRAVVLTGAGRAFSAGQDLSDRVMGGGEGPPDLGETLDTLYNPLVRKIRLLPVPVVAAVNGIAAGAAANVAFACDIVFCARSASFLEPFARLGLVPDAGGTWSLPRLVGNARARAMAMLAEPVPAEQAEAWGLVWKVVEDEAFAAEIDAIGRKLAAAPTDGLALIKRAFEASATNSPDAQLDLERDLQREAGRHPDYAEGVAAFMEKRKPNFRGRMGGG